MQSLPPSFIRTIGEVHGDRGRAWLDALPALLHELAAAWSLTLQPYFANLTYNYVTPATRADGMPVVLKVGVPHPELLCEIAALRFFDGRGSARLLAADEARGALLIERLTPGHTLRALDDDDQVTLITADVMRRLWRPAPESYPFPTVARWGEGFTRLRRGFAGGVGPFPTRLVDAAERIYAELDASGAPAVVLHGDLHQDNILAAQRAPWLALDPKGVVGEPAYEVGALLRNLPAWIAPVEIAQVTARRIDLLAEALGFERERITGWAMAQAVLSGWWSYEDHGYGWEEAFAFAEVLYP